MMANQVLGVSDTDTCPFSELDNGFPETLFLIHYVSGDKWGCFAFGELHGLACFRTENNAHEFADWIDLTGMQIVSKTFDEAREIAKSRPMPIVCMMLLDDLDDPVIHYVK